MLEAVARHLQTPLHRRDVSDCVGLGVTPSVWPINELGQLSVEVTDLIPELVLERSRNTGSLGIGHLVGDLYSTPAFIALGVAEPSDCDEEEPDVVREPDSFPGDPLRVTLEVAKLRLIVPDNYYQRDGANGNQHSGQQAKLLRIEREAGNAQRVQHHADHSPSPPKAPQSSHIGQSTPRCVTAGAYSTFTMPPRKLKPPSPLDDCFALVRRADAHRKSLYLLFERFLKSDPYRISTHVDADPWEDRVIEARDRGGWRATLAGPAEPAEIIISGQVLRPPPAREAGVLIGEIVNALRGALDHAIWHFSTRATPAPPDPLPLIWKEVGWPVVLKSGNWPSACGTRLRFVTDDAVRAVIKRAQPFSRRKEEPERDEFAVLHELWNVHKHRHLPLTQLWVGLNQVASRLNQVTVFDAPPGYADDLRQHLREHAYVVISGGEPRPFEDSTELARVRETGPPYSWWPDMHVDPVFAVDIAFDQGPPAYGVAVEQALGRIRDQVNDVLDGLKPLA